MDDNTEMLIYAGTLISIPALTFPPPDLRPTIRITAAVMMAESVPTKVPPARLTRDVTNPAIAPDKSIVPSESAPVRAVGSFVNDDIIAITNDKNSIRANANPAPASIRVVSPGSFLFRFFIVPPQTVLVYDIEGGGEI